MTAKVMKIGNSQAIVFDVAFMNVSRLKVGDRVDVTVVPEVGAIILWPLRRRGLRPNEISAIVKKDNARVSWHTEKIGVKRRSFD